MADTVDDTVEVAVKFTIPEDEKNSLPSYTDTLFINKAEFEKLSDSQLDALKHERYDAWVNGVRNPPVVEQPPEPELDALDVADNALDAAMEAVTSARRIVDTARKKSQQAINTGALPESTEG